MEDCTNTVVNNEKQTQPRIYTFATKVVKQQPQQATAVHVVQSVTSGEVIVEEYDQEVYPEPNKQKKDVTKKKQTFQRAAAYPIRTRKVVKH